MKRVFTRIALTLVSLAVTVAALEVIVRVVKPRAGVAVSVNMWDADMGTRHRPGARGFVRCRDYDMDLIINSKGLRDREFAFEKPAGTARILFLGDSFICGYGVDANETIAKVLERLLDSGDPLAVQWEVLNAGVGSTGTAQQLAYFLSEGEKYDPDLVVLGFFVGNDYYDSITSGLYTMTDGELVKHAAPLTGARRLQIYTRWIPGYNTLFARSHLLNLVRTRVAVLHRRRLAQGALPATSGGSYLRSRELVRELLVRLRDECRERDCTLVVIVVTSSLVAESPEDKSARELVAFTSSEGIPCLDLSVAFAAEGRGEELVHPHDRHWNADGHREAAELLHAFLLDNSLLELRGQGSGQLSERP